MTKKNYISATLCLLVAIAVMVVTSMNFLAAREVPLPMEGPTKAEIHMLSEWNPNLKDTNGDTPVYILNGKEAGGSALILGGTHPNEPSGYMGAITFIETAVIEKGTVYVIPYTNHSAATHNDPGEGNIQYFTIPTQSGERTFRFGSRATHPNEPSGYMGAFTFIETAVIEKGTAYVIPYTNHSAATHNDPGEGNIQYFTINTKSGERTFRFGSRATNPIDQWPDPDVYVHNPSGQQMSGSETRNINRAYPGVADGNLTERMAYGVAALIRDKDIDITFDLHEASPEYPVINATVAHQDAMTLASEGCINLLMGGIEMSLEQSPTNMHGLTHRELGDYTDTLAILMETANASQGRLRGASGVSQAIGGLDKFYVIEEKLDMLAVPFDEAGHPIEERVGRHLQGIYDYVDAFNNVEAGEGEQIVFSGVPGYDELFLSADPAMLGGAHLGSFLK